MIAFIVSGDANSNIRTKNPYNYLHAHVNSIELQKNSQSIPKVRLRPNFEDDDARCAYRHLTDNTGIKSGTNTNDITYKDFTSGMC